MASRHGSGPVFARAARLVAARPDAARPWHRGPAPAVSWSAGPAFGHRAPDPGRNAASMAGPAARCPRDREPPRGGPRAADRLPSRRADPGGGPGALAEADRGASLRRQHAFPVRGPRLGGGRGCGPRKRRALPGRPTAGAARRHSGAHQGSPPDARNADASRHLGQGHFAGGQRRGHCPARRGGGSVRQEPHHRVGHVTPWKQHPPSDAPQSLREWAGRRRLVDRGRGRGRARNVTGGAGLRCRRVDPHSRGAHRALRPEADLPANLAVGRPVGRKHRGAQRPARTDGPGPHRFHDRRLRAGCARSRPGGSPGLARPGGCVVARGRSRGARLPDRVVALGLRRRSGRDCRGLPGGPGSPRTRGGHAGRD